MIEKIYIPTLGRVDKQTTWENLPPFLKDITVVGVQPKEKDLHGDKSILVLPENNMGICKTRKFLYEYAKNQRYGVFDDDLIFLKTTSNRNLSLVVCHSLFLMYRIYLHLPLIVLFHSQDCGQ